MCHWGGVCVYFLKSVRKGRFRNVWVGGGGGRWSHFLSTELEIQQCMGQSNAQGTADYSESESSSLLSLSTKARTPLGHTSPCLGMGTYFFNFPNAAARVP